MSDSVAILPKKVRVTFPKIKDGTATGTLYVIDVKLTDLTDFAALIGFDGEKTFHDTALACFSGNNADPSNLLTLTRLANIIARDYYRHVVGGQHDVVYVGIRDWQPEALTDCIEWVYQYDDVHTRVMREPWNQGVEELLHRDITCSPGGGYAYGYGPTKRKGCVTLEFETCVGDKIVKVKKKLEADVPLYLSDGTCDDTTTTNPPGPCPPGQIDTSAYSNCDCSPATWGFNLGGIINGTGFNCPDINGAYTMAWDGHGWSVTGTAVAGCGFATVSLRYNAGSYYLTFGFQIFGVTTIAAVYRVDGINWNCGGPNTMPLISASGSGCCQGWPANITVG